MKKTHFASLLANIMSTKTLSTRTAKQVLSTIGHLEKAWRLAHNFAISETVAGILEGDGGEETFQDIVKSKCPFYYELLDVMADRASSKPKCTSYDLSSDDDDDKEVQQIATIPAATNDDNDEDDDARSSGVALSELSDDDRFTPELKRKNSQLVASGSNKKSKPSSNDKKKKCTSFGSSMDKRNSIKLIK
jgi:hypothetical protein